MPSSGWALLALNLLSPILLMGALQQLWKFVSVHQGIPALLVNCVGLDTDELMARFLVASVSRVSALVMPIPVMTSPGNACTVRITQVAHIAINVFLVFMATLLKEPLKTVSPVPVHSASHLITLARRAI